MGRRGPIVLIAGVLLAALTLAPAAWATTQTAHSGNVTATLSFTGTYPNYSNETLSIAQSGTVLYDEPVVSRVCNRACAPLSVSAGKSSVQVLDLEPGGQPDVVLSLYSGGAHCCDVEQIFSFDPGTMTYVEVEHNFGDPGERIVDLGHNGRYEFLTADDSFAYEFTDFAASGLPIQILTFSERHFVNVTRHYPTLIAKDAALWLKAFKSMAGDHYRDSVGVIAAWAADEDELGHEKLVGSYLGQQAAAGHLNSALGPPEPSGQRFIARLQKFLRAHGYLG